MIGQEEHEFLSAFILNDCIGNYLSVATATRRWLADSTAECSTMKSAVAFLQTHALRVEMPAQSFFRLLREYYLSNALHDMTSPMTFKEEQVWQKHLDTLEQALH